MSPDIALSVLASREAAASTESDRTMNEKPIHESPPSSDSQDISSPSSSSTTANGPPSRPSSSFSLSSLKSFFTTPGPASSTGTVRKMPAFLMIATTTTALLFTGSSNLTLLPQAHASAVPLSSTTSSTSSYLTDPLVSASLAIRDTADDGHKKHDQNTIRIHDLTGRQISSSSSSVSGSGSGTGAGQVIPLPQPGPIKWNTHCTHPGEEGIWNCMNTTWQRCVQGRWSVVMRSSSAGGVPEIHEPGYNKEEIVCVPAGVSHEVRFVDRREAAMLAASAVSASASAGGTTGGALGKSGSGGTDGAALGATTSGNLGAVAGSVAGTETKWAGGGSWNGRYWSGAGGENKMSGRERMVLVLAVAGAIGVLLGFPGVL